MEEDDSELLFFDTFSHESCEDLNLDLVQFPVPVYVSEIRVIPLGARVQADFPGGHRLGATHPSSFNLEFFVNDLSRTSPSTFHQLGCLQYKQNVDIQLPIVDRIPTDGLVLRGLYSAVTLAVYGIFAKLVSKKRESPPPPPPPQTNLHPKEHRIGRDQSILPEWDHHPGINDVSDSPVIHSHTPVSVVEVPRFTEVPPIIHSQPELHVQYQTEIPQPVYSEPPPSIVYPECIPSAIPSVPPTQTTQGQYQQYDARYPKTWQPPTEDPHYPNPGDSYDSQVYRPPEPASYPPSHTVWDSKDCHPREIPSIQHSRSKDRRDKPWDRDSNVSDYKDDDLSRDRDYKRKERDHRSWDRSSDSDRYRDRTKESSSRDREKDRDRDRDRARDKRSHDSYSDRSSRGSVKRPVTPPTPPPRPPQTPPEQDKIGCGPRTPKEEEPSDSFDDAGEIRGTLSNAYYETQSPERRLGEGFHNLSEGEIQEGDNTEDDDGYEEIVSEEEIMSDGEDRVLDMDIDFDLGDETWNYMSSFSPDHCELTLCQYFDDPTVCKYEIIANKTKDMVEKKENSNEENSIVKLIETFQGKEHTEKWIEALESLNSSNIADLLTLDEASYEDAVNTLIDWVLEGLDFELALQQPQTAYKVRHIKAGIRVASLLFQTNVKIVEKLLVYEVPKLLLQMFDQPYMVLPVKLLILRALDSVTYTEQGTNFLLNRKVEFATPKDFQFPEKHGTAEVKTGYQKILDILISKQLTRAVVSISALIEKFHLFGILQEFHVATENLCKSMQLSDPKPSTVEDPMQVVEETSSLLEVDTTEHHSDLVNTSIWDENIHIIITCLNDVASGYRSAWRKMTQPKRLLPARNMLEFPKSPFDPYPGIFRMFKENHLLEDILSLLSIPMMVGHLGLMTAIRELLVELLHSQQGMLFLLSSPEAVNGIHKHLLQNLDETREESADENIAPNLGLQIVYNLQALLYVDGLLAIHSKDEASKSLDDQEAISILHHMYTMIFSPIGRSAVVDVLSLDKNLKAILPFVQMIADEDTNIKLGKSACTGYATELLNLTVHFTENVSFLETYSEILHKISQQDNTPKLRDIANWVAPARKMQSYTHEDISYLVTILKSHLEDASSLSPELLTAVKIIKHICLPSVESSDELKYTYATIQLFSNDGFAYILTILQNICETYLKPSHQSVALSGQQGVLLLSLVKLSITIIKNTLGHLISCRGSEFQDLTSVPVLLQVFSLMLLVPSSSFSYHLTNGIQNDIVEIFLTFTQPCPAQEENEESLSKSLWTKMILDVLKYTQQSPCTFVSGLSVLSELFPLPLPLQTREPLNSNEVNLTIHHRKLWSAHLHPLSNKIQEIIVGLAATSCHSLQQLLRRVCIQLSDLATPTALVTVRSVIEALVETFDNDQKDVVDVNKVLTSPAHPIKACSSSLARVLNLTAYLVSHSSFKIPLMHVLSAITKLDEKYADVLPHLLVLMNLPSEITSHMQAQECIVSILQSLCDPDIGFVTVENGATVNEVLASSLPCKEQILAICGAFVQHIGNNNHHYASILPSLRSLVMLTEHDFGFYHVRQALEQHPESLRALFSRLVSSVSKDSPECFSTLSTILEFLRLMVNGYEEGAQTGRSMLLPAAELANWLRDPPPKHDISESRKQPLSSLIQLEKALSECEEDGIDGLLDSLSGLIIMLNEGSSKEENKDVTEPVLQPAESLANQFSSRTIFLVGDIDEERLNPAYWLSVPVADEVEQDQEQVSVDLMATAEDYIAEEFDLKKSVDHLCSSIDVATDLKEEKCISTYNGRRRYQNVLNPGAGGDGNVKRRFIAPMRGRGFSRVTAHSSRANDPFRSRPPNTSRPPSMHVDDFVALESHHTGPAGQTQQKRQDGTRGRGRGGFDRSQAFSSLRSDGSGRFFNQPGYGRRDTGIRGETCGNRGTTRISNSAWTSRTSSNLAKSPAGSNIRTFSSNRPSISDRSSYSPFAQPEQRLTSQRNRDSYSELSLSSGTTTAGRFTRGIRVTTTPVQGHWQETRSKAQNQRFISSPSTGRGSGRRDLNGRHPRSFTR